MRDKERARGKQIDSGKMRCVRTPLTGVEPIDALAMLDNECAVTPAGHRLGAAAGAEKSKLHDTGSVSLAADSQAPGNSTTNAAAIPMPG
jgi:hypothetical protein